MNKVAEGERGREMDGWMTCDFTSFLNISIKFKKKQLEIQCLCLSKMNDRQSWDALH